MPDLVLEGASSEYSFADVKDAVNGYQDLVSPFAGRNYSNGEGPLGNAAIISPNGAAADDAHLRNQVKDLGSELDLRQEEYTSNLREKEATI